MVGKTTRAADQGWKCGGEKKNEQRSKQKRQNSDLFFSIKCKLNKPQKQRNKKTTTKTKTGGGPLRWSKVTLPFSIVFFLGY